MNLGFVHFCASVIPKQSSSIIINAPGGNALPNIAGT